MGRYLTPNHVLSLAAVIEAVHAGKRVRFDHMGDVLEGTLRGFTHGEGYHHFGGEDIRDSHVRITLAQGGDMWIETEEAAGLYEEGSFSV